MYLYFVIFLDKVLLFFYCNYNNLIQCYSFDFSVIDSELKEHPIGTKKQMLINILEIFLFYMTVPLLG